MQEAEHAERDREADARGYRRDEPA